MNGNTELLNYIYQNTQMGIISVDQIIGVSEDRKFIKCLNRQRSEYLKMNATAKELLNQNNLDEKGISKLSKIKTYMMINIQTITDKSSSHLAEMMIIGSNMGVIDAIRIIKQYDDAEKEILILANELKFFEEANINELKKFI